MTDEKQSKIEVVLISVRHSGNPMSDEDRKLLHEATMPAAETLARLPDRIKLRFVTSLIVSFCMNSDDVGAAYELVGAEAKSALHRAQEQERERGGRA